MVPMRSLAWVLVLAAAAFPQEGKKEAPPDDAPSGETGSVVQVANLIYDRVKSSVCFSDNFLRQAEQSTKVSTSRRFHPTKLDSKDLFKFPFVIMTGEGTFSLPEEERKNLADYLKGGGFLLASAGCSSPDWDRSFRAEISKVLPNVPLNPLKMDHPVFHTVKDIAEVQVRHGTPRPLEGIELNGRLAVIYSSDGLNDTAHVTGCCCCGGNEISNCVDINLNILVYALTH